MTDRFDWTPQAIQRLREMIAEGCTGQQVADDLGGGLSRNAVIGKASRLGLTWPSKPVRAEPEPPPPEPEPEPPPDGPVHFLDRPPGRCIWPLWEHPARIGLVCGAVTERPGTAYCCEHHRLAWAAPRVRVPAYTGS